MIVTCVTHHPGRPEKCVLRTIKALTRATSKKHLIDLRLQGEDKQGIEGKARGIVERSKNTRVQLSFTRYEENTGLVRPHIDSVSKTKRLGATWWANLDDDGDVPVGAWDLLIEALKKVGPLAGCAQANPRPEPLLNVLKETPAGIRILKGFLDEGSIEDRVAWHVVECVGVGCSVFRRSSRAATGTSVSRFRRTLISPCK